MNTTIKLKAFSTKDSAELKCRQYRGWDLKPIFLMIDKEERYVLHGKNSQTGEPAVMQADGTMLEYDRAMQILQDLRAALANASEREQAGNSSQSAPDTDEAAGSESGTRCT